MMYLLLLALACEPPLEDVDSQYLPGEAACVDFYVRIDSCFGSRCTDWCPNSMVLEPIIGVSAFVCRCSREE